MNKRPAAAASRTISGPEGAEHSLAAGGSASPRAQAPRRPEEVAAAFEADYPPYQYRVVEFLTEHLADVSRAFGGDLQQMLVLAILGQVHLQRHLRLDGRASPLSPDTSISASRIADVTGIPRQTVRRKLAELEKRGWIERTPSASYRLIVMASPDGSPARRDLSDVDRRSMLRFARLYCDLGDLLSTAAATER
jgi:DNA-binding MarR family transcriptional regulator